jgi:ceramide glucosyltransferase
MIAAAMLRDLMIPLLWLAAWSSAAFVWRGNVMTIADSDAAPANR